jgi:hypothetical protein
VAFSRPRVLHHDKAAARFDLCRTSAAIFAGSGQDHSDNACFVDVGCRLEQHIDRRPRIRHPLLGGQGKASFLNEQVVPGRGHIDSPWHDGLLVFRFSDGQSAVSLQGRTEGVVGILAPMLSDGYRQREVRRQTGEQDFQGVEPPQRGADDDERKRHYRILR